VGVVRERVTCSSPMPGCIGICYRGGCCDQSNQKKKKILIQINIGLLDSKCTMAHGRGREGEMQLSGLNL
jgi:hypothetical protein